MKFTISTAEFQKLLKNASRVVTNNKLVTLGSYISLSSSGNELTTITSDGNNYLYLTTASSGDAFTVVVDFEKLNKLVSKFTCENITVEEKDHQLKIKGNGNYTLNILVDSLGNKVEYPNPYVDAPIDVEYSETINSEIIKRVINISESSLALPNSCIYENYYLGECSIATDSYRITKIDNSLCRESFIIHPKTLSLINIVDKEDVSVEYNKEQIQFIAPNFIVYSTLPKNSSEFALDAIQDVLSSSFKDSVVVDRKQLISALDRLELFIDYYDKNTITLHFKSDSLEVMTQSEENVEQIPYSEGTSNDFTCKIDITLLLSQLKTLESTDITIEQGENTGAIKLLDNDIIKYIALVV